MEFVIKFLQPLPDATVNVMLYVPSLGKVILGVAKDGLSKVALPSIVHAYVEAALTLFGDPCTGNEQVLVKEGGSKLGAVGV